jgi:phosphate starvation-inducible protein PhoH
LDVVRHPLVQEVIRAYSHMDRQKRRNNGRLIEETKKNQ